MSFLSHPKETNRAGEDPEILEAKWLTLTPSVTSNYNYIIMVGD
jgi:hypothetical protein